MESIGIGTYSFGMKRGLSTQEKLKRAAECGYTGVELLTKDLEENTVEELQQWLAENLLLQGESKAKYRLCFYDHIGNLIEEKVEISLEKPLEIPHEAMLVTGETVFRQHLLILFVSAVTVRIVGDEGIFLYKLSHAA